MATDQPKARNLPGWRERPGAELDENLVNPQNPRQRANKRRKVVKSPDSVS
jgi:hypothetical protein